jgi:VIT1/CCC1 family predicted Fe2+/Mn2+ transporter
MTHGSDSARPLHSDEHSTGELVRQLSEQVSVLVRDELKLARIELTRKSKQAGLGAGLLGSSGVVALYGAACMLAAAIIGISHVISAWLAALVVGAGLMAIAMLTALIGKARLSRAVPPTPETAVQSVKADVEEIKEKAHR